MIVFVHGPHPPGADGKLDGSAWVDLTLSVDEAEELRDCLEALLERRERGEAPAHDHEHVDAIGGGPDLTVALAG